MNKKTYDLRLAYLGLRTADILHELEKRGISISQSRASECFGEEAYLPPFLLTINRQLEKVTGELVAQRRRDLTDRLCEMIPGHGALSVLLPCDGVVPVFAEGAFIGTYYPQNDTFIPYGGGQ